VSFIIIFGKLRSILGNQVGVDPFTANHSIWRSQFAAALWLRRHVSVDICCGKPAARRCCLLAIDRRDRQTNGRSDRHRTVTQTPYTVSHKTTTMSDAIALSYNNRPISIIFGRNVTERVSYQMLVYFIASKINASALRWETWASKIATFRLITVYLFIMKHRKLLKTFKLKRDLSTLSMHSHKNDRLYTLNK